MLKNLTFIIHYSEHAFACQLDVWYNFLTIVRQIQCHKAGDNMADKFDKHSDKDSRTPEGTSGHSLEWDDFLAEFRRNSDAVSSGPADYEKDSDAGRDAEEFSPEALGTDDDIEIHSLEDLGMDDDMDLTALSESEVTSDTISFPAPSDRHGPFRFGASSDPSSPAEKAKEQKHRTEAAENGTAASSHAGSDTAAGFAGDSGRDISVPDPEIPPRGQDLSPGKDASEDAPDASDFSASSGQKAPSSPASEPELDLSIFDELDEMLYEEENPSPSPDSPKTEKTADNITAEKLTEDAAEDITDKITDSRSADTGGKESAESELRSEEPELRSAEPGSGSIPPSPAPTNAVRNAADKEDRNREQMTAKKTKKTKKGEKKPLRKRILRWILALILACIAAGIAYVAFVIITTPEIDPDNLYSQLDQTSVLYDDSGSVLEYVNSSSARTNVTYDQLPQDLINAFIAIEDKTFFEHHGFNFVRIAGAIAESLFSDQEVSGTSTITQQLARNLYLTKDRTMTRKIREAYYTIILEKNLTKEQILEAYLNTIDFGYNSSGVQAAAQAYFGCDVGDLTVAECATLASIPRSPAKYSPLKTYYNEDVSADSDDILLVGDTYTIVYNDAYVDRQHLVLKNMYDQGMLTEQEYQAALAEDIKSELRPSEDTQNVSSYFADYCLDEVEADLMEAYDLNEDGVRQLMRRGLRIYSTLNVEMQQTAEAEFSDSSNFPGVSPRRDRSGNIISSSGSVLMYQKSSYFNSDDTFTLSSDEFTFDESGNLVLLAGNRLSFYTVSGSDGGTEEQIEFKQLYYMEGGILYSINGGVIGGIDAKYKTKDADGNLVISREFLDSADNIFIIGDGTVTIGPENYTLRQETIQPQGSMVVTEFETGQIKVMVGGRSLKGRLLYNRANNPRQPGSSIKPIGVYGPAIQSGVDLNTGWTAGSTIEDSPNYVNGKLWPRNSYSGYLGWITLRTAVERSANVPAVRLLDDIGIDYSIEYLKKNGISTIVESSDDSATNDENLSALALGGMTRGISPIEMASAYGTFPNGGVYVEPTTYTKVTDTQGNVLLEKTPEETQVYDEGVAFIMTSILQSTVTDGIGHRAAIGIQPVGGKTGTTTDNYDAWFVGFTPQYAASVWIGNDVNIELTQGSAAAASLWSTVMRQIAVNATTTTFRSMPSNVYVSGGEYYVQGTYATGRPVSSYYEEDQEEEEEPEVLYDEQGRAYTVDPNTGERVYSDGGGETSSEGTQQTPDTGTGTDTNTGGGNTGSGQGTGSSGNGQGTGGTPENPDTGTTSPGTGNDTPADPNSGQNQNPAGVVDD